MKHIIFIFLIAPLFVAAQNQTVYVKLADFKANVIKGDVLERGYENQIQAFTMATSGKNNSQVSFTMNIIGASADLKRAMANGELLSTGELTVTKLGYNGVPVVQNTIKMEKIKVLACSENMGCDNTMMSTVTLQPARIGWTYYQTSKGGLQTVSNKYGYDLESGGAWTNF